MIGDTKKTKDNRKAREDCKELGVHRELWIQDDGTMPNAPYVLSWDQLLKLFRWIYTLQLPDGYASNISRHVADVLIELSNFFQDLCSANLKYSDLEKIKNDIARIISKLDVMVFGEIHLMVHSLEMTEVPRALLNDRMQSLATAAFPNRDDPKQQELWTEYMWLAMSFIVDVMALNKKVILEVLELKKAPWYDNDFQDNDEDDEDQDAENYSLY
ncbi:hypothetical protein AgCh_036611 [Apium graveolens]